MRPPAQGQSEEAEVCLEPPELEESGDPSETGYAPGEGQDVPPSQAPPQGQPAPGYAPTAPEEADPFEGEGEEDPNPNEESEPTDEPWEAGLQALTRFGQALTTMADPWCPGHGPETHGRRRRVGPPGKGGGGDPPEDEPSSALPEHVLDSTLHALGGALRYLVGSANWELLPYLLQ